MTDDELIEEMSGVITGQPNPYEAARAALAVAEPVIHARLRAERDALNALLDDLSEFDAYGWLRGEYIDSIAEWVAQRRAMLANQLPPELNRNESK